MQVHNGKDVENILIDYIDNAIWKTASLASPYVVFEYGPGFGETEDVLDGGIHISCEIVTETWLTSFIIVYSGKKFALGFRVKKVFHPANRA
jgi:hypothetical protein